MPRGCAVCGSTSRKAVDDALLRGESAKSVGARFGISAQSVVRHRASHVRAALQRAASADASTVAKAASSVAADLHAVQAAGSIATELRALHVETMKLLELPVGENETRKDLAAVIREGRSNLELLGRLSGEVPFPGREAAKAAPAMSDAEFEGAMAQHLGTPEGARILRLVPGVGK